MNGTSSTDHASSDARKGEDSPRKRVPFGGDEGEQMSDDDATRHTSSFSTEEVSDPYQFRQPAGYASALDSPAPIRPMPTLRIAPIAPLPEQEYRWNLRVEGPTIYDEPVAESAPGDRATFDAAAYPPDERVLTHPLPASTPIATGVRKASSDLGPLVAAWVFGILSVGEAVVIGFLLLR